jgi:hypothetical protein
VGQQGQQQRKHQPAALGTPHALAESQTVACGPCSPRRRRFGRWCRRVDGSGRTQACCAVVARSRWRVRRRIARGHAGLWTCKAHRRWSCQSTLQTHANRMRAIVLSSAAGRGPWFPRSCAARGLRFG